MLPIAHLDASTLAPLLVAFALGCASGGLAAALWLFRSAGRAALGPRGAAKRQ